MKQQVKTILAQMPHPKRVSEKVLGSDDGLLIFQSMIAWLENQAKAKAA